MKLIIGLGNPGKKYEKTRHNYGFLFVDFLAKKQKSSKWRLEEKFFSEISEGKINGVKIILAKPQTTMNVSGKSAEALVKFYKIKSKDILIAHDDVDIPFGKFKISFAKHAAGHKGVLSIIKGVKTIELYRLRLGTQPGKKKIDAMKLVLGKFTPTQQKDMPKVFNKAAKRVSAAL